MQGLEEVLAEKPNLLMKHIIEGNCCTAANMLDPDGKNSFIRDEHIELLKKNPEAREPFSHAHSLLSRLQAELKEQKKHSV
ncbi:MAG: hypothetical protein ABL867_10245 [Rickettsiales bacterium]